MTFASASADVQQAVYTAASNYGIDPALLFAIGNNETGLNGTNPATGGAGEIGTFQILPSTATGLGFSLDPTSSNYVGTLQNNANAAAKNIASIEAGGTTDTSSILAQYNEGAGNIQKYGVVDSTKTYIANALAGLDYYTKNNPSINGNGSASTTSIIPGSNYTGTGSTQTTTGNWLVDLWQQYFTKGANTNPPPETSSQQHEDKQIEEAEQFASTQIGQVETSILLGGLALALVAGGFALLAADNKGVRDGVAAAFTDGGSELEEAAHASSSPAQESDAKAYYKKKRGG